MRQSPLRRQPHARAALKERLQEEKREAKEQPERFLVAEAASC